jgi:hypothetical protein
MTRGPGTPVTPRRTRPFTSHAHSGLAPSHCATSTWGPFVNPSFCRAAKPASTDLRALIVSRVELWIFPIPSPRALALASLVRSIAPVFGPAWAIKLCTGPLLHRFYSPRPGLPTSTAIRTVRERVFPWTASCAKREKVARPAKFWRRLLDFTSRTLARIGDQRRQLAHPGELAEPTKSASRVIAVFAA